MYNWIHDDITWCGDECYNIDCERNLSNKLNKDGLFSMALFKNTPTCPLFKPKAPKKYIKKPVLIEAVQWTGENTDDIYDFIKEYDFSFNDKKLNITTLEGVMTASVGDYIIKGVHGEYYPCKPDIFQETYQEV